MIVHYPRFDVFVYCIYYDICTVLTLQSDFRNLKKQTRNEFGHTVKKATLIKITGMVDLVYSISLSVLSSGTLVSYRTKGLKHCFCYPHQLSLSQMELKISNANISWSSLGRSFAIFTDTVREI